MAEASIHLNSQDEARALFGPQDEYVRRVRTATDASIVLRGNEIRVFGTQSQVSDCCRILSEWQGVLANSGELLQSDVIRSLNPDVNDTTAQRIVAEETLRASDPSGAATIRDASTSRRPKRVHVGSIQPKTNGQQYYMNAMQDNALVFSEGPAGSGKTYLAVAMALQALQAEEVRKVVLVRPAVEAGEKLGFLPGDMQAKVNPYLRPLLDAINEMLEFDQVRRYMSNDVIEVVPLAFMRGRTLNDTFMILDEGQNTTITQMKMFLTRMGVNSRIVVTGDSTQNDLPKGTRSGLIDGMERLSEIDGVAIVRLTGKDIVRHRLVREIVSAYDDGSGFTR
ncbi:MAG: PhoH family protein [Fuerstiella sp.]|nr:PhoH family protein [Fuerstiella sp.]